MIDLLTATVALIILLSTERKHERQVTTMTEDRRDRTRLVQDRIIEASERRGYTDDMRVSNDMPATITLAHLRAFIFPEHLATMENVLLALTNPNRR